MTTHITKPILTKTLSGGLAQQPPKTATTTSTKKSDFLAAVVVAVSGGGGVFPPLRILVNVGFVVCVVIINIIIYSRVFILYKLLD